MKKHNSSRSFMDDIESRKKGPFSIFLLSYELPPLPDPKIPANKHVIHQLKMEAQREKKVMAREWHKNHNRRVSTPPIVLV